MTDHEHPHTPEHPDGSEATDLLSVQRVAKRLGISESGVYRLTNTGNLVKLKIGTRTMFEVADVERYIARCRAASRTDREESRSGKGRRAVVLLSGGLDSATVLAIVKAYDYEAYAISFRYGQRHAIELEAARTIAQRAEVREHRVIDIDLRQFGGSALTDDIEVPKGRSDEEMGSGIPITYVPVRNLLFLTYATMLAEVRGADDIWLGVNSLDYSGYPDCRPEFIESFEHTAGLASKRAVEIAKPHIHAPLMQMTKAQIIARGMELGVDYSLTHSCYDPAPDGAACGMCDSCVLRVKGFRENGLNDPAPYQSHRLAA
jgi:7-cyano-7-deazaguanine synthase